MGVFIKDMEIPETCEDCNFHIYHSAGQYVCVATPMFYPFCLANSKGIRKDFCPLVDVPAPHGRLIDADKLHDEMYHRAFETDVDTMWQSGCWVRYRAVEQVHDNAPTVIEAEK